MSPPLVTLPDPLIKYMAYLYGFCHLPQLDHIFNDSRGPQFCPVLYPSFLLEQSLGLDGRRGAERRHTSPFPLVCPFRACTVLVPTEAKPQAQLLFSRKLHTWAKVCCSWMTLSRLS